MVTRIIPLVVPFIMETIPRVPGYAALPRLPRAA